MEISGGLQSGMDHGTAERDDIRYLVQPPGTGENWVFRVTTSRDLLGVPNPWDGKPLGTEIN
jgi:hypothetical protein